MRKIIRYNQISYNAEEWEKKITWGDPDLSIYRGSKDNGMGGKYPEAIEDDHIMFQLVSLKTPAKILLVIPEDETRELQMSVGGEVLIGNGFVYFDTRLGDVKEVGLT